MPIVNHIRAPALISGLLLLVYFPLILGPAGPEYLNATGHPLHGYLRNWLLITAALFLGSARRLRASGWVRLMSVAAAARSRVAARALAAAPVGRARRGVCRRRRRGC